MKFCIFAENFKLIMEEYARTERISSLDAGANKEKRSLLERASDVARGVLESIQALAGTTNCKGVQILQLKKWAQEEGCWIEDINKIGVKEDRGSENEVYRSLIEPNVLYKLNDFRYSEDNLTPFFVRIKAHNHYFGNCPYDFIGMAENSDGKICALISQPFIHAEREATEEEIHDAFIKMGFHAEMNGEYYSNGIYDIFDALPNNVLMGLDGFSYFIDTIICPTDESSWDSYHKMSPRFSKDK